MGRQTAGQRGPEAPSNCELTTGHNLDSTTCQDQQDMVMGGHEEAPLLCLLNLEVTRQWRPFFKPLLLKQEDAH